MSLVREEAVRCSHCRRSYFVEYAIDTGRAARPVETECPHCSAKVMVVLASAAHAFQTRNYGHADGLNLAAPAKCSRYFSSAVCYKY